MLDEKRIYNLLSTWSKDRHVGEGNEERKDSW